MHLRPGLRVQGGGLLYQSRGRVGAFRERVQRSKQDNVFDESILLSDRVQFLLPALAALVNDVVTNSLSFTCAQLNTEFKIAAEALKSWTRWAPLFTATATRVQASSSCERIAEWQNVSLGAGEDELPCRTTCRTTCWEAQLEACKGRMGRDHQKVTEQGDEGAPAACIFLQRHLYYLGSMERHALQAGWRNRLTDSQLIFAHLSGVWLRTDLAIAEEARKADEQRCVKFMAEAATVREELGSSKLEIANLSEHQRAVESELQAKAAAAKDALKVLANDRKGGADRIAESSISEEVAELARLRAALAEAEAACLAGSKRQEELIMEAREAQDELASAKRDLSERTDPRQQWPGDAHEMSGWERPRRQFLRQRSVSGLLKRRCRLLELLPLRTRGE
eukprot:s4090_g11.t1